MATGHDQSDANSAMTLDLHYHEQTNLLNLMLHVLHLTSHSAIPLVRAERKEVDRVLGSTQERDENMCGVAVTDDGYGRLLAHDCNCSGCGCQDIFCRNVDWHFLSRPIGAMRSIDRDAEMYLGFVFFVQDNFYAGEIAETPSTSFVRAFSFHSRRCAAAGEEANPKIPVQGTCTLRPSYVRLERHDIDTRHLTSRPEDTQSTVVSDSASPPLYGRLPPSST